MSHRRKRPTKPCFVYFAQCNGADGPVKIGFSTNVAERLSDLQIGSPYPISLLGCFKCANASTFERSLHLLWGDLRIRGEWFRYSPEFMRLIQGMADIERIAGDRVVDIRITRRRP